MWASLSRNIHDKPLTRRCLGRRGEQTESSTGEHCAGSVRARKEDRAFDWGTGLEKKNLNFGSSSSNRSSLLIYQGKRCHGTFLGCGWSCRNYTLGNRLCMRHTRTSSTNFGVLFHDSRLVFCPVQEGLSLFGLRGCIPGIYMEPNDCNYITWSW